MKPASLPGSALPAIILLAMAGSGVQAGELSVLYRQATKVDPVYLEVVQRRRVADEAVPQARANLLPRLSLEATTYRQKQKIVADDNTAFGGTQNLTYNDKRYSLSLRQPLYRPAYRLQLRQANHTTLQAQATEQAAQQNLLVRLSEAYFNILSAYASLDFVRAEKRALDKQLNQARQRLELGSGTVVDVEEAKAGRDRSTASELQAENDLAVAIERLREITGAFDLAEDLRLDPSMPLDVPEPDDVHYWVQQVNASNPNVQAAQEQLSAAEQAVDIARSGHRPSLDVVGAHNFQSSGGRFGTTDITGSSVGLEFSVPLYEGGGTTSRVRQERHAAAVTREQLEQTKRIYERQARESYASVLNDVQRAQALEQAVLSTRTALQATRAGFEVGTRTAVDVVTAEQNLSQAQRDHIQARHSYVINLFKLKQAAGQLKPDDLYNIDRRIIRLTDNN